MSEEMKMKVLEMLSKGNAFIGQLVMEVKGDNHFVNRWKEDEPKNKMVDEEVSQAIMAINGDKKPLNSKRLWAAVYWYLRWAYGFPVKTQDFCDRVNTLPLGELEYGCDYNCIRHFTTLTFMNQDPRDLDKVKPSKMDEPFFLQCRPVVMALREQLEI